jgi:hypothetical protein
MMLTILITLLDVAEQYDGFSCTPASQLCLNPQEEAKMLKEVCLQKKRIKTKVTGVKSTMISTMFMDREIIPPKKPYDSSGEIIPRMI